MADLLYENGSNKDGITVFEDVPATMRAVKTRGDKTYQFEDKAPTPKIGAEDVLIKVARSGICHTDVFAVEGNMNPLMKLGEDESRIIGHEFAGEVVAAGPKIERPARLKGSKGLALALYGYCGDCPSCQDEQFNLCRNAIFTGIQVDGGFADYVVLPAKFVLPIPDKVSFDDAFAVGDALLTAQHAINLIDAHHTQGYVAIYGACGGLGLAVITHLLTWNEPDGIIGIDTRGDMLSVLEKKLGIRTINSMEGGKPRNVAKELKQMTKYGLTKVIDCVGTGGKIDKAYAAIEKLIADGKLDGKSFAAALMAEFAQKGTVMDAIAAVNKGGQVCVVGSKPGQQMLYPVGNWMGREVGVVGPWGGTFYVAERVLRDMEDGRYAPETLAGKALALLRGKECPFTKEGFDEGYKALTEGKAMGRVYFNMDL